MTQDMLKLIEEIRNHAKFGTGEDCQSCHSKDNTLRHIEWCAENLLKILKQSQEKHNVRLHQVGT